MDKVLLRKTFFTKRNKLVDGEINLKSKRIFNKFTNLNFVLGVKKVLTYLPINNEVNTQLIIGYLKQKKVNLFLPAYKNGAWIVIKYDDDNLVAGPFGTLQPKIIDEVNVADLDLAIMTGIAFGDDGHRVGYGKGVYDKMLAEFKGIKVGLAYEFQITDKIPVEVHDIKMDYVITEKRVIVAS